VGALLYLNCGLRNYEHNNSIFAVQSSPVLRETAYPSMSLPLRAPARGLAIPCSLLPYLANPAPWRACIPGINTAYYWHRHLRIEDALCNELQGLPSCLTKRYLNHATKVLKRFLRSADSWLRYTVSIRFRYLQGVHFHLDHLRRNDQEKS
jgi:hypothetical protein